MATRSPGPSSTPVTSRGHHVLGATLLRAVPAGRQAGMEAEQPRQEKTTGSGTGEGSCCWSSTLRRATASHNLLSGC